MKISVRTWAAHGGWRRSVGWTLVENPLELNSPPPHTAQRCLGNSQLAYWSRSIQTWSTEHRYSLAGGSFVSPYYCMLTVAIISDNTQLMTLQLQTLTSSTCNDRDHSDVHSQGLRLAYHNFWNKRDVLPLAPLGHFLSYRIWWRGRWRGLMYLQINGFALIFFTVPIPIGWTPVCGFFGTLLKLHLKFTFESSVNMVWVDVRQISFEIQTNSYA
jgi:hypothetical protein